MDVKCILYAAVIFVVVNTRTVNADCTATTIVPYVVKRFGNDCDFMCHCENNTQCDYVTGNCLNGCEAGWYGPACQYRNAVNGSWCDQIDDMNPAHNCTLAFDGNVNTCSMTNNATSDRKQPPWWMAWLPSEEYITELTITTIQGSQHHLKEFHVFIENVTIDERNQSYVSLDTRILCYKHGTDARSGISFTVICDTPAVGNQVRIQLNSLGAQLVLCDVKINGGRNMAFQRNVTYSSLENEDYPAEYSVDGIGYHNVWDSCFGTTWVTARTNHWWTIHFGHDVVLHKLNLDSVNDDRIMDYQVIAYDNASNPVKIYDDKGHIPPTREVTLGGVRLSKLTILRVNIYRLVLCEVELYGDCPKHTCGLQCDRVCHCAKLPSADKISSKCSMGCEDGWTGMENKCDSVCKPGTFGMNCSETCGHCKERTTCLPVNGTCLNGCQPGYTGSTCKEDLVAAVSHATETTKIAAIVLGVLFTVAVIICFVLTSILCRQRCSRGANKTDRPAVFLSNMYLDDQKEGQATNMYMIPQSTSYNTEHVYDKI